MGNGIGEPCVIFLRIALHVDDKKHQIRVFLELFPAFMLHHPEFVELRGRLHLILVVVLRSIDLEASFFQFLNKKFFSRISPVN